MVKTFKNCAVCVESVACVTETELILKDGTHLRAVGAEREQKPFADVVAYFKKPTVDANAKCAENTQSAIDMWKRAAVEKSSAEPYVGITDRVLLASLIDRIDNLAAVISAAFARPA